MNSYKGKKYYNFTGLEDYYDKCLRLPLNDYVVVDIETTGLTTSAEIIEVCALHIVNGNVVDKYSSLIDYPERKTLPKKITELTGITLDMMREDGGYVEDVLQKLYNFIGDKVICCHNAKFDISFLINKFEKYIEKDFINPFIDTLYISREFLFDKLSNHKLPTLARYLEIDTRNLHRAEGDCIITYQVYEKLKELFLIKEFESQDLTLEDFNQSNTPMTCSKLIFWGLCLILFTPFTLSYLVWKHVNGGKPIKIFIITLIWLYYLFTIIINIG